MRLIDADELIVFEAHVDGAQNGLRFVPAEFIEAAPTIEAEPVTRCKDCIYYRQEIDTCDEPYSTAHNVVHENDYCSRAKRKEHEID